MMRASLSEEAKTRLGLGTVWGLGSVLLVLHVFHVLGESEDFLTFLFGILIPMLFALGLLVGGGWLRWSGADGTDLLRVGKWCLVGANALALAAVLTILHEQAEGGTMSEPLFVVVSQASIGAAVGFLVGVYDVRQRRARDRAEQLSNQLSVLNRVLRHDIRNVATVIQGRIDTLADRFGDPEDAGTIHRKAARLVELGDQARAIERLLRDEDDGDGEREVVAIDAIVEEHCTHLADVHPDAEITTSTAGDVRVYAHPLIESAITNVLDNAVEHNDRDVPRVAVEFSHVSEAGTESVELRIADNGPGIPEEEIAVLERGYETALNHTSGLGLWLVNWIVRSSGGDVRFEENEPAGSVVCIRLERATATADDPAGR